MAISSFAFPILRKAQFYERSLQEHRIALHVTVPANFLMSGAALNTLGATHTGHTPSEWTIAPAAIQPGQQFGAGRCGDFFGNTWTQGKQQLLGKKWKSLSTAGTVRKRPARWDYKKDNTKKEKKDLWNTTNNVDSDCDKKWYKLERRYSEEMASEKRGEKALFKHWSRRWKEQLLHFSRFAVSTSCCAWLKRVWKLTLCWPLAMRIAAVLKTTRHNKTV